MLLSALLHQTHAWAATGAESEDGGAKKTLTVALPSTDAGVGTFNPLEAIVTNDIFYLLYDRLVEQGADQRFYPAIAASWASTPDGLLWRFRLREDVRFHDGSPLDARAVKEFLDAFRNSPSAYMLDSVREVRAPEHLTLELVLQRPDLNLLYNLSRSYMGIASMAAVRAHGDAFGTRIVVGSGPFQLESWILGERVVLRRYAGYRWGSALASNRGPAKVDRLVFREMREAATRFLELRAGAVDVLADLPAEFLRQVAQDARLDITRMPSATLYHVVMNSRAPPLDDKNVRRALALSVNQEVIARTIYHGTARASRTYLVEQAMSQQVSPEYEIRFDPRLADSLLRAAGWIRGRDGIRMRDGRRLTLSFLTQNEPTFRRLAIILQAQLERAGAEVRIRQLDSSTIRHELSRGKHQLVLRSYGWDNPDILEWFFRGDRLGYPNAAMWSHAESDRLMQRAMTEVRTLATREDAFRQYHEHLLSLHLWIPVVQPDDLYAYRSRVVMPTIRTRKFIGPAFLDIDTQ